MTKIIRNSAICKKCGSRLESTHLRDFQRCKCGAVAITGGCVYLRRLGLEYVQDTSQVKTY